MQEPRGPSFVPLALALAALCLGNLWAFGSLLTSGQEFLAWDDGENIVHNEAIAKLDGESLRWMAVSSPLGVYEPLSWLAKTLQVAAFGKSARGFHAVSLGTHVLSAMLLLLLARHLFARCFPREAPNRHLGWALAAALFWSLHPLRTEVVAWASGQSYAQAGLFVVLSLYAYVRARGLPIDGQGSPGASQGTNRSGWMGVALASYGCAVLSKSAAVPLPLFLLALDLFPSRRAFDRKVWLEKLPFFAVGGVAGWIACIATAEAQLDNEAVLGSLAKVGRAAHSIASYMGETLWPTALVPHRALPAGGIDLLAPQFLLPLLLVATISIVSLIQWRRRPWLAACWWAALAMLAPVLGFRQHGVLSMGFDRYTYLASLPWMLLAGGAGLALQARSGRWAWLGTPLLCLLLASLSRQQTRVWHDTETLWRHTLAAYPGNSFAANNLGFHLSGQGRHAEAAQVLRQGYHAGNPSLKLVLNLGTTLEALGLLIPSARVYEECLERFPASATLRYNLALMYLRTERRELAIPLLRQSVALDPDFERARSVLAGALQNR